MESSSTSKPSSTDPTPFRALVGGRELLFSHSFVIPGGEELIVDIPTAYATDPLRMSFRFSNADDSRMIWRTEDGRVKFEISGWKKFQTSGLPGPIKIGEIDGQTLSIHFAHLQLLADEETNLAHISLYKGGVANG